MKLLSEKTDGLITFQDLKSTKIRILYAIMFLFLIAVAFICIIPVVWVFFAGFKTPEELYEIPARFFPRHISFESIVNVMSKVNFFIYFKNTLIIIVGCWAFDIFFNGLAGYVLSRIKPKGTALIETVIFWSMLLPGISMAPLFLTFVDMPVVHINLTGSFLPLFLMAGCNAFNIMLFRNFFNSIPMAYIEAARIDGASNTGIFMKIILPLSKPILVVISIFNIIASWSNFMWPYLLLGSTEKEPVSVLLFQISNGAISLLQNEVMLITMLSIIPPVIVYMLLSKQITGGINMSGLKG